MAIRDAKVFGVKVPGQDESIAAACRCVLVALLQRLEAGHAGLVDELGTGIQSDRAVAFQAGALSAELDVTFSEALQILQLAKVGRARPTSRSAHPTSTMSKTKVCG